MNSGIPLGREDRQLAIERIRAYLAEERGEDVGDLAALTLLDFIAERVAPLYYNEGVRAAQHVIRRMGDAVEEDLDAIMRFDGGRRPSPPPA